MATCNFWLKNAQSYYVILDAYECENENGVMEEVTRDDWEWQDLMNDIAYCGEDDGHFPHTSKDWNSRMDAREICSTPSQWETFGNGNAWTTETNIESVIVVRSGYYEGAVLDYEIFLQTSQGDDFYLSEYDNVDDMVEDYLDTIKDIIEWKGEQHKWNVGTFEIQKDNIKKWVTRRIEKEIEKCETFCKNNCQVELEVSARFSNGETWYRKVG